jgi:hypothetical protein
MQNPLSLKNPKKIFHQTKIITLNDTELNLNSKKSQTRKYYRV